MHQHDEEAEQLKQKNIDTAKANYEKDPANKKKEGFYALGLDKKVAAEVYTDQKGHAPC